MNKIFSWFFVFIFAHCLSAMRFTPNNKDYYAERNYEILNDFYHLSIKNNSKIADIIGCFYEKYVKKDIHHERYMTRLLLFLVNMAHKYDIVDDVLENIKKNNEQEIIIYAKEIYLKFSDNNNELIQEASIAFEDEVSIESLNKISFNNYYGVDVVYRGNNIINHHLIDMIFFKIIKSVYNMQITSLSLGVTLPASIWFRLIIIDQQLKMLAYKDKFDPKPYFTSVIIEDCFDRNNYSSLEKFNLITSSNTQKINQVFNSLFVFSKSDFEIIKNSFKFIKKIEDLKSFNKKDHFFVFGYIGYKYDNKKRYTMLNYFTENIIWKDHAGFNDDMFGVSSLINELNFIRNDYSAEKIENIKNNIINQQQECMRQILSKKYFYNKEINDNILSLESGSFLLKNDLIENYNNLIMDFNKKNKDRLNVDKILKIKSNFNESFKKKIFDIAEILKNSLNNKQMSVYNKFSGIYLDYDEFKDVEVVNYKYKSTTFYQKIRNRLFANEIAKLIIIKLIKLNFVNDNSGKQDVINLIKEKSDVLLNNKKNNLFGNEIIYLDDLANVRYKSKSKNLIGIDVFIFNEFLREFFLKIFYLSPEAKYNVFTKSNKLDIELRFSEWILLFETLSKKAVFDELAVQNIFDKIVERFKDIGAYIKYNNEHPFFDDYLIGKNNQSLRKNLFVYYLHNENKELVDDIKNENNEETVRNKFNDFLSKINYANKILINNKEQEELKKQDKASIDEYLEELLGKTSHISFPSNKKNNKKTQAKKQTKVKPVKKTENKKEVEPEPIKNNKNKQKPTKNNKNNKKPQKQTGFIANKTLHKDTKKTNKVLPERKILIAEPEAEPEAEPNIDLSKYKFLSMKVTAPQINRQFGALQYKLDRKYENKQKKIEENDVVSVLNSNEKPVAIEQKNESSPTQYIEEELIAPVKKEEKLENKVIAKGRISGQEIRKAERKRIRIKEDRAKRKQIAKNAINANEENKQKEQNRIAASNNNYEKRLLELEERNNFIKKTLLKNDVKEVVKNKLEKEFEENVKTVNQIRKKINDNNLEPKKLEKTNIFVPFQSIEKEQIIEQE